MQTSGYTETENKLLSPPCVCIVVPCYNEEEALPHTVPVLQEVILEMVLAGEIRPDSFILLVDDGSRDRTWEVAGSLVRESNQEFTEEGASGKEELRRRARNQIRVAAIGLAHNRGHQTALVAGLVTAARFADVTISIDADLQDDVAAMRQMVLKYREGKDIVYGVRSDRSSDTGFKRASAQSYYKLMKRFGVELVYNHADYRLLSRRAIAALSEYPERNLFLRGLIPTLGFQHAEVYYERKPREQGESKYTLGKMFSLAWEGITSFSTRPIRFVGLLGLSIFLFSIVILFYVLFRYLSGYTVQGWSTTVASVWAIGGLQILSLSIIGEYIGKVYLETKQRPRYLLDKAEGLPESALKPDAPEMNRA